MLQTEELITLGMDATLAPDFSRSLETIFKSSHGEAAWKHISTELLTPALPFALHLRLFELCYPEWRTHPETAPAVFPHPDDLTQSHLALWLKEKNSNYADFHTWSYTHYEAFWEAMLKRLSIVFKTPPTSIVDMSQGIETPQWLPGAKLNIVDSCFQAASIDIALIYQDENKQLQKVSYQELHRYVNQIANSLVAQGFKPQDAIAIIMPMTVDAIAVYLAIIMMGGVVVSIADSFSSQEIATRLRITNAKGVVTQTMIQRGNKRLPLYERVIAANAPICVVIPTDATELRAQDISWEKFLSPLETFTSHTCNAMDTCNILFSSGTTADPKAIPWNHSTAIKAASDAYLHQNIQTHDVLAWPTNLGWMMGPWLIFAALMNRACIAVYADLPTERAFGEFIQESKVTMLGVVPTLVSQWRKSQCMEKLDWQQIKVFSSTGECSNAEDMLYLMSLANYKPIIEYCGGTEIGGSYITSTVIEKNYPAAFTTPALGLQFVLLDDGNNPSNQGSVAIVPPSMGLSTSLLNADHHQIYFADMPQFADKPLRRHGDQACRLGEKYYRLLGRVDDTMNLGGIKISSAEIERTLVNIEGIIETAAIAIAPPQNGPSLLVVFAVAKESTPNKIHWLPLLQKRINQQLNPLFKIHDLVFIHELPKTASNKIMRRRLREIYEKNAKI